MSELEARIRGLNPYARLHRTERAKIDIGEILGRNAFDLDRILEIEPSFLEMPMITTIITNPVITTNTAMTITTIITAMV